MTGNDRGPATPDGQGAGPGNGRGPDGPSGPKIRAPGQPASTPQQDTPQPPMPGTPQPPQGPPGGPGPHGAGPGGPLPGGHLPGPGGPFPPQPPAPRPERTGGNRRLLFGGLALLAALVLMAVGGFIGATYFGTKTPAAASSPTSTPEPTSVESDLFPSPSSSPDASTSASATSPATGTTAQPFGPPSPPGVGYSQLSYTASTTIGLAGVRLDGPQVAPGTGTDYDLQFRPDTSVASDSPDAQPGGALGGGEINGSFESATLTRWTSPTPPQAAECAGLMNGSSGSTAIQGPHPGDVYCVSMSDPTRYASVHVLAVNGTTLVAEITVWQAADHT